MFYVSLTVNRCICIDIKCLAAAMLSVADKTSCYSSKASCSGFLFLFILKSSLDADSRPNDVNGHDLQLSVIVLYTVMCMMRFIYMMYTVLYAMCF